MRAVIVLNVISKYRKLRNSYLVTDVSCGREREREREREIEREESLIEAFV